MELRWAIYCQIGRPRFQVSTHRTRLELATRGWVTDFHEADVVFLRGFGRPKVRIPAGVAGFRIPAATSGILARVQRLQEEFVEPILTDFVVLVFLMQSLEEAGFLDQRVILHHSLLDLEPSSLELKIVRVCSAEDPSIFVTFLLPWSCARAVFRLFGLSGAVEVDVGPRLLFLHQIVPRAQIRLHTQLGSAHECHSGVGLCAFVLVSLCPGWTCSPRTVQCGGSCIVSTGGMSVLTVPGVFPKNERTEKRENLNK
uniref:Uncharacterized protein n=1 Tax=Ananas comosus var. bracteatus TaxID=296719 RepID=A0A6V7QM28_ANACO|nr:unnamed protein product [Ananas comosus var. bracteatus]